MNHYMKAILPFLEEECCDSAFLQDQLYQVYRELHPQDIRSVREAFSQLDLVLKKLPLQEYDRIWNLTCQLCYESERQAFLEGLRVGIRLSFSEYPQTAAGLP